MPILGIDTYFTPFHFIHFQNFHPSNGLNQFTYNNFLIEPIALVVVVIVIVEEEEEEEG
jgi:hypothetical protein